jgi:hypothetical protein
VIVKNEKALKRRLAGIQLALFETVWPAFPWIERILVECANNECCVFVQAPDNTSNDEWSDCDRLVREVLDLGLRAAGISYELAHGETLVDSRNYQEIMSDKIFRQIAAEVAPWRLDSGR